MTRKFRIIDDISIEFDEDIIQWNATYDEIFRTRHGRSLVHFNEINVRILDLLYEYDLTDDEHTVIRNVLWLYLFRVER